MFQLAEVCWDEYAACRISSLFAAQQNDAHAVTTVACLDKALPDANTAIRSYRHHGDLNQLVAEAGAALCQPMKAAAYLLGGMDGEQLGWNDFDAARAAADRTGYLPLFERLHTELRDLWEQRQYWSPELSTFAPLERLASDVYSHGGLHFSSRGDGTCHIDVPFSLETMF